eukprot:TRINITY_DN59700_c0_g1_i1.p1 TRINITY_DN59700_c0_g1~~TRINITY_DN59700_c0_g1_i1.p1  ORF type:complete len:103 (+),score=6.41 TRINITY_DN59700_c0_g1_i1:40-348(+)
MVEETKKPPPIGQPIVGKSFTNTLSCTTKSLNSDIYGLVLEQASFTKSLHNLIPLHPSPIFNQKAPLIIIFCLDSIRMTSHLTMATNFFLALLFVLHVSSSL